MISGSSITELYLKDKNIMDIKIVCLVLTLLFVFFACAKKEEQGEPDDSQTAVMETAASDETDPSSVITEEVPDTKIPAQREMKDGLVFSRWHAEDDWAERIDPLAEWYAENFLAGDLKPDAIRYVSGFTYPFFEDITLGSAIYLARYGDRDDYFSLLYGSTTDIQDTYYLIDGKNTDDLNFKDSWDKVKAHAITGKAAGDLKKTVYTGEAFVLHAGEITGDSGIIHAFSLDDSVALVSADRKIYKTGLDYPNEFGTTYVGLKLDILNASDGTKMTDTVVLKDIRDEGYLITGIINSYWTEKTDEELKVILSYACEPIPDGGGGARMAYYEIKIAENSANSEIIFRDYTDAPFEEYGGIKSVSGRYRSMTKDGDLYILDNETGTDIRVFDSKPDKETVETKLDEYEYASAAFFEGNTLYYNISGYEWLIGSGYYNAETAEKGEFRNGMRISAKIGDRIFGNTSVFSKELFFGVFTADDPDRIEKMPFTPEELERSRIQITGDGKLIKLSEPKNTPGTKWREDISTLTVYDAETLAIVREIKMESPYEYMYDLLVMNGYAWAITSDGTVLITEY